jgi:hypothetical protein
MTLKQTSHLPHVFFQGDGFDFACNFPVQLYLELPNALNVEPFIRSQLAAVAIGRKRVTMKPGDALKSWVACFLPCLYPAKESLKCSLYPTQHLLATGVIY